MAKAAEYASFWLARMSSTKWSLPGARVVAHSGSAVAVPPKYLLPCQADRHRGMRSNTTKEGRTCGG